MKNKKSKKISYPIHKMGLHCGYDEYEDGSIKIAPEHSQHMDDFIAQRNAIDEMLKSCHEMLVPITRARENFWNDVSRDYGFDREKYLYAYHPDTKTITREERTK